MKPPRYVILSTLSSLLFVLPFIFWRSWPIFTKFSMNVMQLEVILTSQFLIYYTR